MDEREFLRKIRRLQESGERIELTDMPVGKRDVVRLVEASQRPQYLIKEEEVQTIEPDEQRDEENKFKDIVSKLVKFDPIKVYPENVQWSGHLIREKIDWNFSLDDTVGCYIHTTELIQLRDETLEVLKKLRGYYDVWSDEWSSRLTGVSPEEGGEEEMEFGGEETGTEEGGFGDETGGEGGEFEF
jgi:hypothetical protein